MPLINNISMSIYQHLPPGLKNIASTYEGYRIRKLRFGEQYEKTIEWLKDSQWWTLERQREYQVEKMRESLRIAEKNVPYYRDVFHKIGITSNDIRTLEDLKKLPVLEKRDLKRNNNAFFNENIHNKQLVSVSTSGTTGTPLKIMATRSCVQTYFAVAWRQRSWFGVENHMSHATFNGRNIIKIDQKYPPFWVQNWASKQTLFSNYHMNLSNFQSYIDELARIPRDYITGYPSSLFTIAKYIIKKNINLPWQPKAIFTSSETLLEDQREIISRAFMAPTVDFYGMGEQGVSASQCPLGNWHFDFEVGIVELLPIGNNPNIGRIVCTGLINHAMPLIRYNTQDIVELSDQSCSCGRQSIVAQKIDGRIESFIQTPDGCLVGRLAQIFKNSAGIEESQIVQTSVDRLVVYIVKSTFFKKSDETKLVHALRARLGNTMKIEVCYVDEIHRESNGKMRAVKSEIVACENQ